MNKIKSKNSLYINLKFNAWSKLYLLYIHVLTFIIIIGALSQLPLEGAILQT